jgi:O-antigen ligase
VERYPLALRLLGLALVPILYLVVRMTDARLGVLGYLISILSYVLFWSLVRFRRRLSDLVSAAIVYGYPAAFLAVLASSMFVHRINLLIFGGGAQASSTAHRTEQFRMALPGVLRNPIGHGAGESGMAMGYAPGDFIAIDSYFINLALDYGVLGLVLYVAMFVIVIVAAVTTALRFAQDEDQEVAMLIPLAACLLAFLAIRGVFGQPDIHPVAFTILGMVVALVARTRGKLAGTGSATGSAIKSAT